MEQWLAEGLWLTQLVLLCVREEVREPVIDKEALPVPPAERDSLLLPLVVAEAHTLAVPVLLRLAEGL